MNKQTAITTQSHPGHSDLVADWDRLFRVFICPEGRASRATLIKYMDRILYGLNDFLKKNVGITEAVSLKDLSERFTNTIINENPEKKLADVITCLIKEIAPHAVNVSSPYFVGHMTSAIPFFMVHLKTIVAALNQNVVKLETSKVVSVLEKQVIAKIHRVIYNNTEEFYRHHVQNADTTLGVFVEGGTTANLTAMWMARNAKFQPKADFKGIEADGLVAAYRAWDVDRCVVLVSRRGHYSLRKAAGILGIGNDNVIPIDICKNNRVDLSCLKRTIRRLQIEEPKTCILAIVGVAGATETGTVDPLEDLAEIGTQVGTHFHVDAAWGGPTLFSKKYRHLLNGISLADSVTIDGHKQFYMPMSCGMLYLKDPAAMDVIAYHSNYVNRMGSVDLGIKTLSGSREANSLILDSALKIMGAKGYALLIDHGIETAAAFAREIKKRELFELMTPPVLNILTYRICPPHAKKLLETADNDRRRIINEKLNTVNRRLQQIQREAGTSFVSRTTLLRDNNPDDAIVVLRSVIMNPMTTLSILSEILDEQERIFERDLKGLLEGQVLVA
ncbi:MAG: putative pyridoxal-dependent aspartate 1-decarboxylase [Desulfobacteraceae bacterium]|nr:putative pyridoxal-dependent aspartate 1-decarboxylase [Desulfobacteraceae bacterium]